MALKFLRCSVCGNIVGVVEENGGVVSCCGQPMKELVANTVDASQEKHVPVYEFVGNNKIVVRVGSIPHPMTPEHHISWIAIKTKMGAQRKVICHKEEAKVCFLFCEHDQVEEIYEYCNLHGLWKTEVK